MANTSSSSITSTLITVRALVRDLNPASLTEEHIALLHDIASFACSNAQDARWVQDEREAMQRAALEWEQHAEARIAWESDAADHAIAHLV